MSTSSGRIDREDAAAEAGDSHQNSRAGAGAGAGVVDGGAGAKPQPDAIPGEIGPYRIIQVLGEGRLGTLYLANDPRADREVALRVFSSDFGANAEMLQRVGDDARAAAVLSHPNICSIYEVGSFDGGQYVAMQYIDGRPLSDFVRPDHPLPTEQVALIVRRIAEAMEYAHEQGQTHRDLRPDNILIDANREPIVVDFGTASTVDLPADARATQFGLFAGTPAYMSPEQVENDAGRIGPASDVYSLGVVLYELLTGRLPFEGSFASVLTQILQDHPKVPSWQRDGIHPALDNVCLKMLSKPIEQRYAAMREVAASLGDYLDRIERESREKIALTAFDRKKALRDARVERLEMRKRHVENLRNEGEYAAAISMLRQMARIRDPQLAEYAEWAEKQIPVLTAEPERIRKQRGDALETARQLIRAHDYQSAVELLQQIPPPLRTEAISALLKKVLRIHKKCESLTAKIDRAFTRHETAETLPLVEKLLELRPNFKKAKDWYFQLTGRRYGERRKRLIAPWFFWPLVGGAFITAGLVVVWAFNRDWGSLPTPKTPDIAGLELPQYEHKTGKVLPREPEPFVPVRRKEKPDPPDPPVNVAAEPDPPPDAEGADWKPIDLLKSIDLKRDAVTPTWRFEGDVLVGQGGDGSRHTVQIPLTLPAEYEVRMVVTRMPTKEKNPNVTFYLLAGGTSFEAMFDQRRTENGLYRLDKKNFLRSNASFRRLPTFGDGTPAEIRVTVTREGVYATINGKIAIDWQGDYSRLFTIDTHIPPNPKQMAIRSAADCRISKLELHPPHPGLKQLMQQPIEMPDVALEGKQKLSRLFVGESQMVGNKVFVFDRVPAELGGKTYVQSKPYAETLKFRVTAPTTLVVGLPAGKNWLQQRRSPYLSVEQFQRQGWKPYPQSAKSGDLVWELYIRDCKPGESFSIRNNKYQPPILISVKSP